MPWGLHGSVEVVSGVVICRTRVECPPVPSPRISIDKESSVPSVFSRRNQKEETPN